MAITHTIFVTFKPDADPAAVREMTARFVGLKDACVRPDTKQPYILAVRGGRDLGLAPAFASGPTHAFVFEFATAADHSYYAHEDPAHLAFIGAIRPLMASLTIVDFEDGSF